MTIEVTIKTIGLTKTYKGRKGRQVEALKDLNLEIYKSEIFGFLGPNGAGKSTTIKILMGLIFPTEGRFLINGIEGNDISYKRFIGYLPENPSFYEYLTAEELLTFVGRTFEMDDKKIKIETERLLKLLDLFDARKRYIRSYSKGMVQRLGLAQALIHDPEILILDEPMSGLDPLGRILVKDIILELRDRGKTVFMSTHILNDIEILCDRVGIIVQGTLKKIINMDDLMTKGISSYILKFSKLSADMRNKLREYNAVELSETRFRVSKEYITDILYSLKLDENTELRLIEPQRKGLEVLFKEVIRET
jgi:ABC-2 type transport system ATP-binding protein